MKGIYIIIIILSFFATGARPVDQFPQAEITNGLIHARIYLPDVNNGYYRASRFDWSGVMPELEYKGHTYFGQWFDKYDPMLHDAIMGPVEDFYPVGYDEAKTGGTFLKIGIGMVTKPEEAKYSFAAPYPLINPGTWKIKTEVDEVEFTHTLKDKEYAYEYNKKIQLVKGKPDMGLSHTLKNTGTRPIETDVYDHNFFVMDKQPVSQDFVVSFPFNITAQAPDTGNIGRIEGSHIKFLKELVKNDHAFYRLQGFSDSTKDYDITIGNRKTGAAVKITSDRPLSRLVFWSAQKTLCPEPYIHIKILPGETFTWKINYQFYTTQ